MFIGYGGWLVYRRILLAFTTDLCLYFDYSTHTHCTIHFMSSDVCMFMLMIVITLNNNFIEIVNKNLVLTLIDS